VQGCDSSGRPRKLRQATQWARFSPIPISKPIPNLNHFIPWKSDDERRLLRAGDSKMGVAHLRAALEFQPGAPRTFPSYFCAQMTAKCNNEKLFLCQLDEYEIFHKKKKRIK